MPTPLNPFTGYQFTTDTIRCAVCSTRLTGGVDTFGGFNAPYLCANDFLSYNPDVFVDEKVVAELKAQIVDAEGEISSKEREAEEIESDIDDLYSEIASLKQRIKQITDAQSPTTKAVLSMGVLPL